MKLSLQKRDAVDLAFIGAFLALAALELIVLRDTGLIPSVGNTIGFYTLAGLILAAWLITVRRSGPETVPAARGASGRLNGWLGAVLLLALTLICFYRPLRIHFWGGGDDAAATVQSSIWTIGNDERQSRPLAYLVHCIAHWVMPQRIEGPLCVAVALNFLNALTLSGILRNLAPSAALVPAAGAVLYLSSRADAARFLPMWAGNVYGCAIFFLLLSLWLFLVSFDRRSRLLLVLACFALAVSLLIFEAGFPLSLLGVLLLWPRRKRGRFLIWSAAWLGTVGVLATRLGLFFLSAKDQAYQIAITAHLPGAPGPGANLLQHLKASWNWLGDLQPPGPHWPWGIAALVLAGTIIGLAGRATGPRADRRTCLLGFCTALLALMFALAPYLAIEGLFRTHFYAVPADAALLAFALGWLETWLPRRPATWLVSATVAILAANATVASIRNQNTAWENSSVTFENTVHVFQQVHGLCPSLPKDALLLFVLDDGATSPLGYNYSLLKLSQATVGASAIQANHASPAKRDLVAKFHPDAITIVRENKPDLSFGYDHVIAFRLSSDGSVSLLPTLPPALAAGTSAPSTYRPLNLLKPGMPTAIPYLRYPSWADKPLDIFNPVDGILFGPGWGPLRSSKGGRFFREVGTGMELAVNPLNRDGRDLAFQVEPPKGTGSWELRALDQAGKTVTVTSVTGRGDIRLMLPLDPRHVSIVRLEFHPFPPARTPSAGAAVFRISRPSTDHARRIVPDQPFQDVLPRGLMIGGNWHALEREGKSRFRWVDNDAEIRMGLFASGGDMDLALTVEPGPGMGGNPCRLQLIDKSGLVLGEGVIARLGELRFDLPTPIAADAVFKLHVEGGGRRTPGDSRILNFRVFRGELVAH